MLFRSLAVLLLTASTAVAGPASIEFTGRVTFASGPVHGIDASVNAPITMTVLYDLDAPDNQAGNATTGEYTNTFPGGWSMQVAGSTVSADDYRLFITNNSTDGLVVLPSSWSVDGAPVSGGRFDLTLNTSGANQWDTDAPPTAFDFDLVNGQNIAFSDATHSFGLLITGATLDTGVGPTVQLPYQGRLTDAAGTPINGTTTLGIRVLDHPTADAPAANVLFEETFTGIELNGGYFSVVLGDDDSNALPLDAVMGDAWIEISPSLGTPLEPRQKLHTNAAGSGRVSLTSPQSTTCDAGTVGQTRYDKDAQLLRTCDGAQWSPRVLVEDTGLRQWSDGTFASSCEAYRRPMQGHSYAGAVGDGMYRITTPAGDRDVYCDQTTQGGGWTALLNPAGTPTLAYPGSTLTSQVLSGTYSCPGHSISDQGDGAGTLQVYSCANATVQWRTRWPNELAATDVRLVATVQGQSQRILRIGDRNVSALTTGTSGGHSCAYYNATATGQSIGVNDCHRTYSTAPPLVLRDHLDADGDIDIVIQSGPAASPNSNYGTGGNVRALFVR